MKRAILAFLLAGIVSALTFCYAVVYVCEHVEVYQNPDSVSLRIFRHEWLHNVDFMDSQDGNTKQ